MAPNLVFSAYRSRSASSEELSLVQGKPTGFVTATDSSWPLLPHLHSSVSCDTANSSACNEGTSPSLTTLTFERLHARSCTTQPSYIRTVTCMVAHHTAFLLYSTYAFSHLTYEQVEVSSVRGCSLVLITRSLRTHAFTTRSLGPL